ncbi:unnamed protein product [Vitrella brassicaformis CCMP3155]|uniref:Uncharacterized protein n=1 Tax=Vitrella brassicaformis (strain CCMP3155) TaxID=1169540 RepID=A0A0G4GM83_VITBC|nr:unnamed protein product [Vitrella brassicaformis CCMP3155]|mmetsp:Transcript_47608/g.119039  ORF Transcript_47608/g.119039 Transcript_47608/m.119039 type:complete len:158 (-) Transcript_47608:1364-1837(-)|eukprot:CEM31305.1 unnamed protein product [Vitrella brassicaformis CCMP3155]
MWSRSLIRLAARKRKWQSGPPEGQKQPVPKTWPQNWQQQQQFGGGPPPPPPPFGTQLWVSIVSLFGAYIGIALVFRLFGGARYRVVHVDDQGRRINPRTGKPMDDQQGYPGSMPGSIVIYPGGVPPPPPSPSQQPPPPPQQSYSGSSDNWQQQQPWR